ncbi:MAG: hypothetical protein HZA01_03015 [Nitrospinae bacterium]|nr:hypothetical protein [Nitrospinota bacterium]
MLLEKQKKNMYLCKTCPFLEKGKGHPMLKDILKCLKGQLCALREGIRGDVEQFCSAYEGLNREKEALIHSHPCEKARIGTRYLFNGFLARISSRLHSGEFPYKWREDMASAIQEVECRIEKILESRDVFIVRRPENINE